MTLVNLLTAAMLGVVSLSSGAVATRDLQQDWPAGWPPKPDDWPADWDKSPKPSHPPPSAHSGGSSGGSTTVVSSSASCSSVAIGYSKVENDKARASASAAAADYICGKGGKGEGEIATATAKAFALAVAHASAECKADGNAHVSANAYSKAKAQASVWLEAYAHAFASASCKKCDAYASSWGYIKKDVFLKAVAEAEVSINESTKGGKIHEKVSKTKEDIELAVAVAYAKALSNAKKYHGDKQCAAWASAGGCIYSEHHGEQCFKCDAHAVSAGDVEAINAIATAAADASAFTCGGKTVSFAVAKSAAKAIAEATAKAISFVYASCKTDKGAYACSVAHTQIETAAKAVAVAFAKAWAGALHCKHKCKVDSDSAALAIGEILVKAATEAYGKVCVGNGADWTVASLRHHIETGHIKAIAKAAALAISSNHPQVCLAATTANSYVGR